MLMFQFACFSTISPTHPQFRPFAGHLQFAYVRACTRNIRFVSFGHHSTEHTSSLRRVIDKFKKHFPRVINISNYSPFVGMAICPLYTIRGNKDLNHNNENRAQTMVEDTVVMNCGSMHTHTLLDAMNNSEWTTKVFTDRTVQYVCVSIMHWPGGGGGRYKTRASCPHVIVIDILNFCPFSFSWPFRLVRAPCCTSKWTRINFIEHPMNGRFGAFPISMAINYSAGGISICAFIFVFKSINGHWRGHKDECSAFGACITDDFVVFPRRSIIKLMKSNKTSLVAYIYEE